MNTIIEKAEESHCKEIQRLSSVLGYDISLEETKTNIESLSNRKGHRVWVATLNGGVIGWCHAGITHWVMMPPMIEVFGLVVDERLREKGVGALLIKEVFTFAEEARVEEVWVRSNKQRASSHWFYKQLGFTHKKDQAVYTKDISS